MIVNNPNIPFCSPVGGYIAPGTIIRITGNVTPYCQCFAINLQCGGSVNPRDDVALHLSPVFSPPPRIVRNSIQNNNWGPEESFGGFPLSVGQQFEFMIYVEQSQFKIALNGMHFTEFRHRLPFERISHIAIDGDVRIDLVSIDSNSSGAPSMPGAPYPMGGVGGMPPYPMSGPGGGGAPYPPMGFEPPPAYSKSAYPTVPPVSGAYAPGTYSEKSQYPGDMGGQYGQQYPQTSGQYSQAGGQYPQTGGQYPQAGGQYPQAGSQYPQAGGQYPQSGQYPAGAGYPPQQKANSGIGGKVTAALGGLTAGVAATSIGSALFGGNKHGGGQGGSHMPGMGLIPGMSSSPHKPKKSSSIPIGTIAAGAGAAALGAVVLSKVHPFKKAKKMFKHKHKGGWHHKGWSSSSSSSSEEE